MHKVEIIGNWLCVRLMEFICISFRMDSGDEDELTTGSRDFHKMQEKLFKVCSFFILVCKMSFSIIRSI